MYLSKETNLEIKYKIKNSINPNAILILEKEIPTKGYRIATKEEVMQVVENQSSVFGIGYGVKKFGGFDDFQSFLGCFWNNLQIHIKAETAAPFEKQEREKRKEDKGNRG